MVTEATTTAATHKKRQQQILKELENAKYCIWIADPWFQDKEILDTLIDKINEGLSVEIILTEDDPAKDEYDEGFKKFIESGGEVYYVSPRVSRDFKYKEFCIVDFKTVILGAYKRRTQSDNYRRNVSIYKNFSIISNAMTNEYFAMKNLCAC